MTHEELDRLGPELEKRCNDAIHERFSSWSRYAVNRMVDETVRELAPNWTYLPMLGIGAAPRIALTEYRGEIGTQGVDKYVPEALRDAFPGATWIEFQSSSSGWSVRAIIDGQPREATSLPWRPAAYRSHQAMMEHMIEQLKTPDQ